MVLYLNQIFSKKLRFEKGNQHEKDYLKELKKKHKKVLDLKKSDLTREEKISKTIQAMKEGWEIIHGGWLKKDKWTGEFDFLIINKELKSLNSQNCFVKI